jgi:hypothetical protein
MQEKEHAGSFNPQSLLLLQLGEILRGNLSFKFVLYLFYKRLSGFVWICLELFYNITNIEQNGERFIEQNGDRFATTFFH